VLLPTVAILLRVPATTRYPILRGAARTGVRGQDGASLLCAGSLGCRFKAERNREGITLACRMSNAASSKRLGIRRPTVQPYPARSRCGPANSAPNIPATIFWFHSSAHASTSRRRVSLSGIRRFKCTGGKLGIEGAAIPNCPASPPLKGKL